jgi:drug/metabolite transporter (DMT)-like permease
MSEKITEGKMAHANVHASSRSGGFVFLLITATGWALNWPAMKILLREWPPLFSRGVAGVTAALILAALAASRGDSLRVPGRAVPVLLLASVTNVFVWMGFATLSMKWVSVAQGALLVYTMPIWVTLLSWPIRGARPTRRGYAALLLGLAGVIVLLGGHGWVIDRSSVIGSAFAIGAAIAFALGTVLIREPLPLPALSAVAWQVGLGCLPMIVLGLAFERPAIGMLDLSGWLMLAYMTLVPMGVCYLSWFATLRRLPPESASIGMLLVPLLGTLSAAWLIGEPVGLREAVSMLLTLSGITLALRRA